MVIKAVVIGAGGFGRETLDVIEAWNRTGAGSPFEVLGVIDDAPSKVNLARVHSRGYQYLGGFSALREIAEPFRYFVGIGNPQVRARIVTKCDYESYIPGLVVHPNASIGSDTILGAGSIVCGGVQVSTNVSLGRHVHLNPGSIIGHDTAIEDCSSVNPGAVVSGDVIVETNVLIGARAVILQGLTVGTGATIGANACVTRTVPPNLTFVGTPARPQNSLRSANNEELKN